MTEFKDATLTSLVAKFGICASDYYEALTWVDAPEPQRKSYTRQCRESMDKALVDVLAWVEKAYKPRGDDE